MCAWWGTGHLNTQWRGSGCPAILPYVVCSSWGKNSLAWLLSKSPNEVLPCTTVRLIAQHFSRSACTQAHTHARAFHANIGAALGLCRCHATRCNHSFTFLLFFACFLPLLVLELDKAAKKRVSRICCGCRCANCFPFDMPCYSCSCHGLVN